MGEIKKMRGWDLCMSVGCSRGLVWRVHKKATGQVASGLPRSSPATGLSLARVSAKQTYLLFTYYIPFTFKYYLHITYYLHLHIIYIYILLTYYICLTFTYYYILHIIYIYTLFFLSFGCRLGPSLGWLLTFHSNQRKTAEEGATGFAEEPLGTGHRCLRRGRG